MNHHLFRHLVEKRLIAIGSKLSVFHAVWEDGVAVGATKGTFTVEDIYSNPMLPDTQLTITDGDTTLNITKNDIKLIDGKLPSVLGTESGFVPFELPPCETGRKLNALGKPRRIHLSDSLDTFTSEDYTPDNYVEEKVDPGEFLATTHIVYG